MDLSAIGLSHVTESVGAIRLMSVSHDAKFSGNAFMELDWVGMPGCATTMESMLVL